MKIEFGPESKAIAGAIKHICSCCRTVPMGIRNDRLLIAQQTDNNLAWIELSISMGSRKPSDIKPRAYVVESKLLAIPMRQITTLKDTLTLEFRRDCLVVTTQEGEVTIEYMLDEPFLMDTSVCAGPAVIAGLLNSPTRDVENMVKDSLAAADTVEFTIARDEIDSQERVYVGGRVMPTMTIVRGGSLYSLLFDGPTLAAHVKNGLAPEVSLQLYEDLPMKLLYCLLQKKKRGKNAELPADRMTATMQIYISPRV